MRRSGTALFVALILAAAALGAIAAWAPLATCPRCLGRPLEEWIPYAGAISGPPARVVIVPCEFCSDRRRVPWLQKRRWVSPTVPIGTDILPPSP